MDSNLLRAAAQAGYTLLVPPGGGGGQQITQQQMAAGQVPPQAQDDRLQQVVAQRDSALRQNEQIAQQLREGQAEVAALRAQIAEAGGDPERTRAEVEAIGQEKARQEAIVHELMEENTKLKEALGDPNRQAPAAAPAPAPEAAEQPVEIMAFRDAPVANLNLPEKAAKIAAKKELATVGQVLEHLLNGDFAKWKLNRADIIATYERLAGRVPSIQTPAALAAPAAPAQGDGGSAGVPLGHADRPWPERLETARQKATKRDTIKGKYEALETQLTALVPGCPPLSGFQQVQRDGQTVRVLSTEVALLRILGDGATEPQQKAAALFAQALAERNVMGVTMGQVVATVWGMGLDPHKGTVDAALAEARLHHLMETPPTIEEAAPTEEPAAAGA